jgi:hypothetical protein
MRIILNKGDLYQSNRIIGTMIQIIERVEPSALEYIDPTKKVEDTLRELKEADLECVHIIEHENGDIEIVYEDAFIGDYTEFIVTTLERYTPIYKLLYKLVESAQALVSFAKEELKYTMKEAEKYLGHWL